MLSEKSTCWRSIDGSLLVNLFTNNSVFLTDTFLSNCADDINLYSLGKDRNITKTPPKNVITCGFVNTENTENDK